MVSCPVCRSSDAMLQGRVSSAAAAQHFVLREEHPDRHVALRDHIEALWSGDTCELRRCSACGFGFAWPYVAGDGRFYNLAYPSVGYSRRKWEFERTVEALRPLAGQGKRSLEIGAGFGFFLDLISPDLVERRDIVAVEYNDECQRCLAEKGYSTMACDVRHDDFRRFGSSFDLIFMFQVLEHMDGLDALMERLAFLASREGQMFIAVPNARQIAFNEQHGGLLDMPPNHIGRWTPRAFDALAARCGLRVVKAEFEPIQPWLFAKTDLYFSYLRRAQATGSLANRVRSMGRGRGRKLLEMALIATYAPARLPAWRAGWARSGELGESLWVHLARA